MVGKMREHADAIVVLGCRVLPSGRPTTAAARRAAKAAEAYLEGIAPHVIASGGRRWGALIEADMLQRELVRAGVPNDAVTRELWSLTTHENAIFSAELLRRRGVRRVAVVTCEWHVDRAIANFRAAGVDAWPLPSAGIGRGIMGRAYRFGHERICTLLDARAMKRADAFTRMFRTNADDEPTSGDLAT
jgi:uncharacterized SAM-binding protein YcdF (DUF218 family)